MKDNKKHPMGGHKEADVTKKSAAGEKDMSGNKKHSTDHNKSGLKKSSEGKATQRHEDWAVSFLTRQANYRHNGHVYIQQSQVGPRALQQS